MEAQPMQAQIDATIPTPAVPGAVPLENKYRRVTVANPSLMGPVTPYVTVKPRLRLSSSNATHRSAINSASDPKPKLLDSVTTDEPLEPTNIGLDGLAVIPESEKPNLSLSGGMSRSRSAVSYATWAPKYRPQPRAREEQPATNSP